MFDLETACNGSTCLANLGKSGDTDDHGKEKGERNPMYKVLKGAIVALGAILGLALVIGSAPASAQTSVEGVIEANVAVTSDAAVEPAAGATAQQLDRLWKFDNAQTRAIWEAANSADEITFACKQLRVVPDWVCDLIPIAAIPIKALGDPGPYCLAIYGRLWPPVVLPLYETC